MEHRTFHRILAAIIAVLIVLAGYGVYYVNGYHHAVNVGNAIQSNPTVKVTDIEDGWLFDGRVRNRLLPNENARQPRHLRHQPRRRGTQRYRRLLIRPLVHSRPFARRHTGSKLYISKHTDNWDGLILLASYPTDDLSKTKLRVLSAYGSKDDILNRKKVESARRCMPKQYYERVIKGGNHAQFGSYGVQQGDDVAAISGDDQIDRTVALIRQFVTNSL